MKNVLYIGLAAILVAGGAMLYTNAMRDTGTAAGGATFIFRAHGVGAMAETITQNARWAIRQIHVTLAGSPNTGNLEVRQDSISGADYDALLLKQDMSAVTDTLVDDNMYWLNKGDSVKFTWSNTTTLGWGLEVFGETSF